MKRCDPLSATTASEDALESARVLVAVRIRPLRHDMGAERYDTSCLYCTTPEGAYNAEAPTTVTIIHPATKEQTDFAFDRVFDEGDGQAAVYSELVEDSLMQTLDRGGDLTVVAYGQTGSGKTFTMLGERGHTAAVSSPTATRGDWLSPDSGVFLRAMNTLMTYRQMQRASTHVTLYLQAVEIYNDTFIDLLAKGSANVKTGWQRPNSAPPSGVIEPREVGENLVLSNAIRVPIETLDDVQRCFDISHKNRSVSSTNMNDASSRSHAIFQIEVVSQTKFVLPDQSPSLPPDMDAVVEHQFQQWTTSPSASSVPLSAFFARTASEAGGALGRQIRPWVVKNPSNDFEAHPYHMSRFTLVDLAGSERVKRSGVIGKGMQEAVFVNSSLSTLGLVVHSLCAKTQAGRHIPFRDSKMTRVLRPAFTSPHSKVIFITNMSPTSQSYVETLNSMRFASRLKDLKYSAPPQNSGPSLVLLLNDERLQRLRQQLDEMAGDVRIYQTIWGSQRARTADSGPLIPSLRRVLVEQQGVSTNKVREELLVRATNLKEALQSCRAQAAAAQELTDKEHGQVRDDVTTQTLQLARRQGRINEDEAAVAADHLRVEIARAHQELLATRQNTTQTTQEWQDRIEALEMQSEAISAEFNVLSKKKREMFHQSVVKRAEFEDVEEEQALYHRNHNFDAARLAVEKSLLDAGVDERASEEDCSQLVVKYLATAKDRLTLLTEALTLRRQFERYRLEIVDATSATLVAHELSSAFSNRLATAPIDVILNSDVVRTTQGRHRLLNERLESASTVFTVSPLAYYFTPDVSLRSTRYVPWERHQRVDASDGSDDDICDDDDLAQTAERCVAGGEMDAGLQARGGAVSVPSTLGEQIIGYYLRVIALYGHLMRITAQADKRRRRSRNAPLLSASEVRAVFVVLDAVEVDSRIVEDVVQRAQRQLQPPQVPSQADLLVGSGLDDHCAWPSVDTLPSVVTTTATDVVKRLTAALRGKETPATGPHRFAPCLGRCLQLLTLLNLYESLLGLSLPGSEGGDTQRMLLMRIAERLVSMQSRADTSSAEDAAILKGCQYACRSSVQSSGCAWSMDDLRAAKERQKVKDRRTAAHVSPNATVHSRADGRSTSPHRGATFLWSHTRRSDVSPLRGLAVRCLIMSQLMTATATLSTTSDTDACPTPERFLECLLLVLRQ